MYYKTVEVEIDCNEVLDKIDTEDLIKELDLRGKHYNASSIDTDRMRELLESIYYLRRCHRPFDKELDLLIWCVLGKIQ